MTVKMALAEIHIKDLEQLIETLPEIPKISDAMEKLNKQIKDFALSLERGPDALENQQKIILKIEKMVRTKYPGKFQN